MTFKDKWYSEHPGMHFNPYLMRCPHSYGYEEKRDRPCRNDDMTCADCWEREIPGEKERIDIYE